MKVWKKYVISQNRWGRESFIKKKVTQDWEKTDRQNDFSWQGKEWNITHMLSMNTCIIGKETKITQNWQQIASGRYFYRVDNINMPQKGGRDRERERGTGYCAIIWNLGFFLHLGNFTILYFTGMTIIIPRKREGETEGEEI